MVLIHSKMKNKILSASFPIIADLGADLGAVLGAFLCAVLCSSSAHANDSNPLLPQNWDILYDGGGIVDFQNGILMEPLSSTSPFESHSSLLLSRSSEEHPFKDFQVTLQVSTHQQLRTPTPRVWEVFNLFFNYKEDSFGQPSTNTLKLTQEGLELGTLSGPHRQTFLATSKQVTLKLGQKVTIRLKKSGNHLEIDFNGLPILHLTAPFASPPVLFDQPGAIGLYAEDARVQIDSIEIIPF